ncbi:hypothetical protein ABFG93_13580 [Pseudalkalibacillus hwajinpoensis]|uniref:hypothetical protein n=1 Tax=Guptibacillus hwajinpoensis TaxID=208199 RepID=UPI00325C2F59
MILNSVVDATYAKELGLVNQVVNPDELKEYTETIGRSLSEGAMEAFGIDK